jgi:protein NirF
MPHLEGWTIAGNYAFVPAVGLHEVLVINTLDWTEAGRIAVHGQPVFVRANPDGRHVWVNFAVPNNDTVQVIDTQTLKVVKQLVPGKGVLHLEFEPRGEQVWISVRDKSQVQIYNTRDISLDKILQADTPSGIFFTYRADRIGL